MALTMAMRQQSKHQRTLLNELGSATAVYENRRDLGRMFEHFSEHIILHDWHNARTHLW